MRKPTIPRGGIPGHMVLDKLSPEQAKELTEEMAALAKQQFQALQTAAYMRMSPDEAEQYDLRRLRIGQICGLLSKFKPE
jgi:hypothetical protein